MNRLQIYLTRMIIFAGLAVLGAALLFGPLKNAFLANPALNGLILGVMVLGVAYIFRQVVTLRVDAGWLEGFREGGTGFEPESAPPLIAPMATMLAERRGRVSLSAISMRTLLDGIASRLDESRDLSRYLIGLLIFLGLLGTFWGLLQTVNSVGEVIAGLSVGQADVNRVFEDLKAGLEKPLGGMGTAFSSSLFGLGGSLMLGFLDLQAGQAQNRFYNDLEEWLSSYTRLSSGLGIAEGDQSVPAYVSALLEKTADSLDELQRTIARGEESRTSSNAQLLTFADRLATLTDHMRTEQELMVRLAETQADTKRLLQGQAEIAERAVPGIDEASRSHLRNLDVYMSRLLEEMVSGRNQMISELRAEIRMVTRTIAEIAEDERR
ncbi:MAG: flagellar motor protein MotA [Alphaproteobacteria bacterium]